MKDFINLLEARCFDQEGIRLSGKAPFVTLEQLVKELLVQIDRVSLV